MRHILYGPQGEGEHGSIGVSIGPKIDIILVLIDKICILIVLFKITKNSYGYNKT